MRYLFGWFKAGSQQLIKFWRVVSHEYTRHVLRRRFIFALLSIPAIILTIALVAILVAALEFRDTPVGFIDQVGLLTQSTSPTHMNYLSRSIPLVRYEEEKIAQDALLAGDIQAYYLIPADYFQTNRAKLVFFEEPSAVATLAFENLVRARLLLGKPETIMARVTEGVLLVVRAADGSREMSERNWFNIFIPFVTGLVFMAAIFTSSGYLLQAVVEEKENRTMEIMITSLSPGKLMSGKIVALVGVGLTQVLLWISIGLVALRIGSKAIVPLQDVQLAPGTVGLMMLVMLPAFVLVGALMATIGATVTDEREGQQVTGLFTLPVILPYLFIYQLMNNPNGPLAVGLSYFPLTAPVTLVVRANLTSISPGQWALHLSILILSAAIALWLAGRAFRLGMLRYGQRVSWREILGQKDRKQLKK